MLLVAAACELLSVGWSQVAHASCAYLEDCPCETFAYDLIFEGRVADLELGQLTVVVERFYGAPYGVAVGDRVAGQWEGRLPCNGAEIPAPLGERMLVLWRQQEPDPINCPEYMACTETGCSGLTGDEFDSCCTACQQQSAEPCERFRQQNLLQGRIVVLPLGDPIDFGDDRGQPRKLAAARLPELLDTWSAWDRDACHAIFPPVPLPPCNDTVAGQARSSGCLLSVAGDTSFPPLGHVLLFGLALVAGVTRKRRPGSPSAGRTSRGGTRGPRKRPGRERSHG